MRKYGLFMIFVLILGCALFISACSGGNEPGDGSSSESDDQTTSIAAVPFTENMVTDSANRTYYQNAYGKSGAELKTALQSIIMTGHTNNGYNWNFETIDKVTTGVSEGGAGDGKVWCIYTTMTNEAGKLVTTGVTASGGSTLKWMTFGTAANGGDQDGGSGGGFPGDKFNREHTWPQSYFNSTAPAVGDRHHLFATDKKLNADHADYPYGEVAEGTSLVKGSNGARIGNARAGLGYSGRVFDMPVLYRGDIARAHFYMAVRYYNDTNFNKPCDFANNGAKLKQWYSDMLRSWHTQDPVSQKEINRNNAVKAMQNNRNPFIDAPGLVDLIDFVN